MVIKNASFVKSCGVTSAIEDFKMSEIAVVGRSNVGKSSLINMLAGQNKLAKTSSTPGRTRLVNYFLFNNEFMLVDLPGYGFAKAGKSEQENWKTLIEKYLDKSKNLKHVLMLVDSRIAPTEKDLTMQQFLFYYNISYSVVATKCDKLSKAELARAKITIANAFKIGMDNIIFTSADKKIGRDKLCERIEQFI